EESPFPDYSEQSALTTREVLFLYCGKKPKAISYPISAPVQYSRTWHVQLPSGKVPAPKRLAFALFLPPLQQMLPATSRYTRASSYPPYEYPHWTDTKSLFLDSRHFLQSNIFENSGDRNIVT